MYYLTFEDYAMLAVAGAPVVVGSIYSVIGVWSDLRRTRRRT